MPQQQKPLPVNQGQIMDLFFCVNGVDVSTALEQQIPDTTPLGINVRAFEPTTNRARGGSRPGISRYIPAMVPPGNSVIQHLQVVVDPQATAIGLSYPPAGGGFPPLNLQTPYLWFGQGSGFPPSAPPYLLIITAKPLTKTHGQTYTFHGNEYTQTGLQSGDTITEVGFFSDGAPASAQNGKYPIYPGNAKITYATPGLYNYTIVYVNNTMTVSPGGITFIQSMGLNYVSGDTYQASLSAAIQVGDLILFFSSGSATNQSAPYTTSVADAATGANYQQIESEQTGSVTVGGNTNNYTVSMWYGFAVSSVLSGTLNFTVPASTCAGGYSVGIAIFRGAAALDASNQNSNSGSGTVSWSTNSISTTSNNDLLVVLSISPQGLLTPSSPSGFTTDPNDFEAYKIGTTGSSVNPSGSFNAGIHTNSWGAIGASFHP